MGRGYDDEMYVEGLVANVEKLSAALRTALETMSCHVVPGKAPGDAPALAASMTGAIQALVQVGNLTEKDAADYDQHPAMEAVRTGR